tara:strand:+ start:2093 stop:2512 length:420 start_codon:yes stop_codon:yes gene_type:complete
MALSKIHKLEKAVIMVLNIDGWSLKHTGDTYEHYDAIGLTPKGKKCVIEMKFRTKYYEEKMIEKYKFDELMKLPEDVTKLYFINDPKGNFMYWLDNLKMPEPTTLYCPDTTIWTKTRLDKEVYLLKENQASRINLNSTY